MIPPGHIILVISRGDKILYEKEGIFNIWSYVKDGELMAAVRDAIEGQGHIRRPSMCRRECERAIRPDTHRRGLSLGAG